MENTGKIIVSDVDDVLVHVSTPWVQLCKDDPILKDVFARISNDVTSDLFELVVKREFYYLQEWMKTKYNATPLQIARFNALYVNSGTFYDDLPQTELCKSLVAALLMGRSVGHIHLVTHVFEVGDPVNESKRRWLERVFSGHEGRYTIHMTSGKTPKSEVIKTHCAKPHLFIDDAVKNVIDVILHLGEEETPREIMLPRMGHNMVNSSILELAVLNKSSINYYDKVN